MQCFIFAFLALALAIPAINSQQNTFKGFQIDAEKPSLLAGLTNNNVELPANIFSASTNLAKNKPYIEVLKLVEAFMKFKGEFGQNVWALVNDNSHIIAALKDTLIKSISSVHQLTLKTVIVLRKVLEFAAALFGNIGFNFNNYLG